MGALKNDKAARGDGRVRIQVTIPDGRYVSGGPFCCFVKVAPIISDSADSKGPVTVDFIAINVYGRACFRNKLLDISKIQSSLRFGFLTEERETLNNNDNVHLIFSSDAVIFCTGTEITNSSSETFYRFTCTIPPFIPPTVDGEDVSCNYYVDVTVQYNANSQSHHRETIRGVPTLDDVYHPFLPKSNGYSLEEGNIRDDTISQLYLDCTAHTKGPRNMFFNYESRVDALDSGNSTNQSPDTFLLSNDLNAFWRVWDTMNGSGLNHEPEESAILRHYNDFVEKFTALITNDSTSKEVEKFRAWFGTVLSTDSCNTGDEVLPSDRKSILEKLVEKVGNQTEIKHGVRIAGLERAAAESLAMQMDVSSDGMQV
ncbi:hypothetical protein X943_003003 [Babesia divergens]|uniref:Uncharacterized protein n=1 Tax=Babesia divergens TaxID=32595 RepID=A0AAD9GAQ0_BABDI|nr:hypothetical protein X943_003003 [Babesia divergens]